MTQLCWRIFGGALGGALVFALLGCGSSDGGQALGPPTLDEISPTVVGARSAEFELTVIGKAFGPDIEVLVGGTSCRYEGGTIGPGASRLMVAVPGGAPGTGSTGVVGVSIRDAAGASQTIMLAVADTPAPVVSGTKPGGPCGVPPTAYVIQGSNFTVDTAVEVNGHPQPIERLTNTSIVLSGQSLRSVASGSSALVKVLVPGPGGGVATGAIEGLDVVVQCFDDELRSR